jgi:hypothetical protein
MGTLTPLQIALKTVHLCVTVDLVAIAKAAIPIPVLLARVADSGVKLSSTHFSRCALLA